MLPAVTTILHSNRVLQVLECSWEAMLETFCTFLSCSPPAWVSSVVSFKNFLCSRPHLSSWDRAGAVLLSRFPVTPSPGPQLIYSPVCPKPLPTLHLAGSQCVTLWASLHLPLVWQCRCKCVRWETLHRICGRQRGAGLDTLTNSCTIKYFLSKLQTMWFWEEG